MTSTTPAPTGFNTTANFTTVPPITTASTTTKRPTSSLASTTLTEQFTYNSTPNSTTERPDDENRNMIIIIVIVCLVVVGFIIIGIIVFRRMRRHSAPRNPLPSRRELEAHDRTNTGAPAANSTSPRTDSGFFDENALAQGAAQGGSTTSRGRLDQLDFSQPTKSNAVDNRNITSNDNLKRGVDYENEEVIRQLRKGKSSSDPESGSKSSKKGSRGQGDEEYENEDVIKELKKTNSNPKPGAKSPVKSSGGYVNEEALLELRRKEHGYENKDAIESFRRDPRKTDKTDKRSPQTSVVYENEAFEDGMNRSRHPQDNVGFNPSSKRWGEEGAETSSRPPKLPVKPKSKAAPVQRRDMGNRNRANEDDSWRISRSSFWNEEGIDSDTWATNRGGYGQPGHNVPSHVLHPQTAATKRKGDPVGRH